MALMRIRSLKDFVVLMSAIPVGGEVVSIDTMELPHNCPRLSLGVDDGQRLNECHELLVNELHE